MKKMAKPNLVVLGVTFGCFGGLNEAPEMGDLPSQARDRLGQLGKG